jgi:type IV secretion system protein VirD4
MVHSRSGMFSTAALRRKSGSPAACASPFEMTPDEALAGIRQASEQAGCGIYLGSGRVGPAWAKPEQAVLVLGPPRSGKTTAIVIPSVISAIGSVVSTSTKPDVLLSTARARLDRGPCFVYDPSGTVEVPAGIERARWSPVPRCRQWDEALLVAGRLVGTVRPSGSQARVDGFDHWTERAQALLAPLLHAAGVDGADMREVLRWVDRREASHAMAILDRLGHDSAADQLAGIVCTETREQSGIWSTASSVLAAYRSEAALATTVAPNLDTASFCDCGGTLYICATGSRQALAAPLVVGLLSEIRDGAYARAAAETGGRAPEPRPSPRRAPLVLALDEVANIAPLPDLPAMVSEGGGQGVLTLACLQDLSQARARWGNRADGFMSLFGTTVVLPGIGDIRTLESLSTLAGDVEVQTRSVSAPARTPAGIGRAVVNHFLYGSTPPPTDRTPTVTTSTTQRRRLPPDAVAHGYPGRALVVDEGNHLAWIGLTRCYESAPWCLVVNERDISRRHYPAHEREVGEEKDTANASHRDVPDTSHEGRAVAHEYRSATRERTPAVSEDKGRGSPDQFDRGSAPGQFSDRSRAEPERQDQGPGGRLL